jgi:hypothetical protein
MVTPSRHAPAAGRRAENLETRLRRERDEATRAPSPALRARTLRALEAAERDAVSTEHRWSFATSWALAASVLLLIGVTVVLRQNQTTAPRVEPASRARMVVLDPSRLDRLLARSASDLSDSLDASLKAEFMLLASDTRDAAEFVRTRLVRAAADPSDQRPPAD